LIANYETHTGARLLAAIDTIDIDFALNLEEHLQGAKGDRELHVLLRSPGGNGEQALRAIRVLQSRCSKLVFVIPDMAKSAATLLALGADEIRLGPASDLGPIDPQMNIAGGWYEAKDIISAVAQAEEAVAQNWSLTPLWANLLAQVTALDVRAAQDCQLSTWIHILGSGCVYGDSGRSTGSRSEDPFTNRSRQAIARMGRIPPSPPRLRCSASNRRPLFLTHLLGSGPAALLAPQSPQLHRGRVLPLVRVGLGLIGRALGHDSSNHGVQVTGACLTAWAYHQCTGR